MATFYVDSNNGNDSNDGSSWALAKLTLGAVTLGDDLTLYTDGVFFEQIDQTTGYDNFTWNTRSGPTGMTIIDCRDFETGWANPSGTIYSVAVAVEPENVAYQYGADDAAGTVTGVGEIKAQYLAGLPDYRRCMKGWLTKAAVPTTTTPAAGEWSWASGTLYANAGESATPDTDFSYAVKGRHGVVWKGANAWPDGLIVRGLGNVGLSGGYGIQFQEGSGSKATRCIIQDQGGHGIGWADSTGNNTASTTDCEFWGMTHGLGVASTSLVLYNATSSQNNTGFHNGGVEVHCYPILGPDGIPVSDTLEHAISTTHTDSATDSNLGTVKDVTYRDVRPFNYKAELEAKHSGSYTVTLGPPISANYGTDTVADPDDPTSYPIQYYGHGESYVCARQIYQDGCYYERVYLNDTRGWSTSPDRQLLIHIGAWFQSCVIIRTGLDDAVGGSALGACFRIDSGTNDDQLLKFDLCTLYNTEPTTGNVNGAGWIAFGGGLNASNLYVQARGCVISCNVTSDAYQGRWSYNGGRWTTAQHDTWSDLEDCWVGNMGTTSTIRQNGAGTGPVSTSRATWISTYHTGDTVDDATIDFADEANLDLAPASGSADLATTKASLHTDLIGIIGINGRAYDGSYGPYQHGLPAGYAAQATGHLRPSRPRNRPANMRVR